MAPEAVQPVLTLLFDHCTEDEIAGELVQAFGTNRSISLLWALAYQLPVVCTQSCEKAEVVERLAELADEHGNDVALELTCNDRELAAVMHRVAQSDWEHQHESIDDAICEALIEAGFTRPIP